MRISDWSSDVCSSDLAIVNIANSSLDEVAVIVNEFRRGRPQRFFAYLVPKTCEIIKIAFDLRLGPLKPCRPNDAAHGVGQFQLRNDRLETLAISRVIDLARNSATMAGRSEEHTSELQSIMRISYAVSCMNKTKYNNTHIHKI